MDAELIQERFGHLNCFHIYHGETRFKFKDLRSLERQDHEAYVSRKLDFERLSDDARYIIDLVVFNPEKLKYSVSPSYLRDVLFKRKLYDSTACLFKDNVRVSKKRLVRYLLKMEMWNKERINSVLSELRKFVDDF